MQTLREETCSLGVSLEVAISESFLFAKIRRICQIIAYPDGQRTPESWFFLSSYLSFFLLGETKDG